MNLKTIDDIVIVKEEQVIISNIQEALDFIATVQYKTGLNKIVISKNALTEEFFVLSSCLAGEILQKFVNYKVKLAIVGDFSSYKSKALKDFIYESNRGKDFYFVKNTEEALAKLQSQT